MTVQHRRSGLPLLAVALAVFAWGFGPLFVKGIDASAPTIVLWRVTIGTAIAVAFAYVMGGRITLRLVVVAFPAACASRSASCSGSRRSRRRRSSTPRSSRRMQPVLILLLATRMFGERRTGVELAYAALALAGVVVVVAGASSDGATLAGQHLRRGEPARVHRVLPARASAPATPTCTRGRSSPRCSSVRA